MGRFVLLTIVIACICGSGNGVAVSLTENPTAAGDVDATAYDVDILEQSDQNQILELRYQVMKLQEAVSEITRSFWTLDLIVKNPGMMSKLNMFAEEEDKAKTRVRRDLDSPLAYPNWSRNSFGPYSWPMFSGQCYLCPAGVPGPRGSPGPSGTAGRDGRDGRDAQLIPQGSVQETPDVSEQPSLPSSQHLPRPVINVNSTSGGAVYIRWGSSECPESAALIYAGTAGGSHYSQAGSGSNYLCMPNEPIYDEVETSTHADRALLYSSEYQTSTSPDRLRAVHDHTPTCAVCRAPPGRTSQLMVPGRNVCPSDDWRLEYGGYLMADRNTHKKSEFICMDRGIEAQPETHGDQNGALFYMVEGRCLAGAGLPCGPYVDGYELTCAVCTI